MSSQQETANGKGEAARRRHVVSLICAWDAAAYPEGGPQDRSTAMIIKAGEALADALASNALGIDRINLEGKDA